MRVLQVGMGGWGRNWAAEVLPRVGGVDLVGCVDAARPALELAQERGVVSKNDCYVDLAEAIDATEPDAVLITANASGHVPLTRASLEAGKHVLVEKPFATSLADASELVGLAAERGLTLMVSQNYRFFPAVRAVQRIVQDGDLGELHGVKVDFRRQAATGTGARKPHHLLAEPLLVDMSIHHFDLLRAVLGRDARKVFCQTWNPSWSSFAGPAEGAAIVVFEGGLTASYTASWLSSATATPWAGEWSMEFERAAVRWSSRHDRTDGMRGESVVVHLRGGEEDRVELPKVDLFDRAGSLAEFVDALKTGREPESSGAENLGSLALMQAAVESSATKMPCAVPLVASARAAAVGSKRAGAGTAHRRTA